MLEANCITQPCQVTTYEKKKGSSETNVVKSEVTEWDASSLLPKAAWKYAVQLTGTTPPVFDFTAGATQSSDWKKQNEFTSYSSKGMLQQSANGAGNITSTIYGHLGGLPIATVANAGFGDCAFYTCAYDDNITESSVNYFDFQNGWLKHESTLDNPPKKHFGEKAVHVGASQGGPSKDIPTLTSGNDYILSAWIYPITVSAASPVLLSFIDRQAGVDPQPSDAEISGLLEGKWNLVRRIIGEELINGLTNGATISLSSKDGSEFYVEDIRFYPKGALATTNFYDLRFSLPIASVDASNN